MTDRTDCLATLLRLIERSDRDELAEAQAAIIQHALAAPDAASRAEAMEVLRTALAAAVRSAGPEPVQQAFHAAVDAMIERTRDAVVEDRESVG